MATREAIRCIDPAGALLGEGPVWVADQAALFWVDIHGRSIHRIDPATETRQSWPAPFRIGALAPRQGGGFVGGSELGFVLIDPDFAHAERLGTPESEPSGNRFNDGKLDLQGRFWAGTMDDAEEQVTGALYRLDADLRWSRLDEGYQVTNGPAFSPDGRWLYHSDSAAQTVYRFALAADGSLSGKAVFRQFGEGDGFPDGMTCDRDGCLWIAFWDGGCLRCLSPHGDVLETVSLPVQRPTSCAFGGEELETLFITSASVGLTDAERAAQPLAGGLFAFATAVPGFATPAFPILIFRPETVTLSSNPPFNPFFMFATGIDSTAPKINGVRHDQMEKVGHYGRWRQDVDLVKELGTRYLRFGSPLHRTFLGPDRYDWDHADAVFGHIRSLDIVPIAELCRMGVPDWIGDFQNPDFPRLFAGYARAFAERYPWIQLYSPVSTIFISALASARLGLFNEARTDEASFVTAIKHLSAATLMAMLEILQVRPDAIFIQSERASYFHADTPEAIGPAETLNSMRFLPLDLIYGHRVDSAMYEYLRDNGMSREEYRFFMETRLGRHCVLGTDYYPENERRVSPDGSRRPAGETLGYDDIVVQYYDRYHLPVMHTETNAPQGHSGEEAVAWLWKEWANALRVRNNGVPLVGFTWFPLVDQVGWNGVGSGKGVSQVEPVGLFDMDRKIRPVGSAYRQLIREWRHLLPAQSVCLLMPIILPSEFDEPMAQRRRDIIHRHYTQRPDQLPPNPFDI